MGFARFLNNKPLDLSGIKQFNPDLDQAEKTLSSIETAYDTTQVLANTLPEHLQGDSERMLALQERYASEMENIRDGFATDASTGNAMLRGLNSTIQKDFGPSGEAFRAGKRYQDVQAFKERVNAAPGLPSGFAQSYLEKNTSESAFDKDGNFVPWEAPVGMPTVPNYSEAMLNAGNEVLPDINSIDEIITDEDGNWTGIKTTGEKIIPMDVLRESLTGLAAGHPEIVNSINEFGDPAQTMLNEAIEGVIKAKYTNDTSIKYSAVSGGKKKKGSTKTTKTTAKGDAVIITEVGENVIHDKKLIKGEERKKDHVTGKATDEVLDKNNTDDAVEIYGNLKADEEATRNIADDVIGAAGDNLAEIAVASIYNFNTNYHNLDEVIEKRPSEYYTQGPDSPNYEYGLEMYTQGKILQDFSSTISGDNFLKATPTELEVVSNRDDINELFNKKKQNRVDGKVANLTAAGETIDADKLKIIEDEVEKEAQALMAQYDEEEIADEFNRSLIKLDQPIINRNGIVVRNKTMDSKIDKQVRKNLIPEQEMVIDGEELSNADWYKIAKEQGQEGDLINVIGNAKNTKFIVQTQLDTEIERLEDLNAIENPTSQQDLNKRNTEIDIQRLTKQLETAPETNKAFENFKKKTKKQLENMYQDKGFIFNAAQDIYKHNQTRGMYTTLNSTGEIPHLQGNAKTTTKLTGTQKVEYMFGSQLGAINQGTDTKPNYSRNQYFKYGNVYDNSSGEEIEKSKFGDHNGGLIGITYGGFGTDANGTYEMIGVEQLSDGKGGIYAGNEVRIQNPNFDRDFRDKLYDGHPLLIKQVLDPLWDEIEFNPEGRVSDTAILGDGYTLEIVKKPNGGYDALVIDSISGEAIEGGQISNVKDSYDLSTKLEGLIRGQQAVSYDKKMNWGDLKSFENGFENSKNITFAKDGSGGDQVERRALKKDFADTFESVFGAYESEVPVTSMLRSLDNQKKLDKANNSNNAGPQYTSGHLVGEGVDIRLSTALLNEMKAKGFDIEKAKKSGYVFEGMKMLYHKNAENGNMHLDIKKI